MLTRCGLPDTRRIGPAVPPAAAGRIVPADDARRDHWGRPQQIADVRPPGLAR
ncbi:hypothetical protein [Micromonospora okii]|uniref:hypothetical protein n=1 Tax=Micromonospora okii TaxID=1182970 RepID=UPI001E3DC6B5|nr:hypothetical protein [Micromonospora okii]